MTFDYHRSVTPMLWVLVGLSTIELLVVHLLLALWWPWLALGVSLLTLGGIGWLVAAIASCRRLPVLLEGGRLLMRTGWLRRIDIPRAAIAGLRGEISREAMKREGVANFALVAHPNIVVDLIEPMRWRGRTIAAVAHRLDDPTALRMALA